MCAGGQLEGFVVDSRLLVGGSLLSGRPSGGFTAGCSGVVGSRLLSYPFGGRIALARLYDVGLTAEEARNNFNALRGRFGI